MMRMVSKREIKTGALEESIAFQKLGFFMPVTGCICVHYEIGTMEAPPSLRAITGELYPSAKLWKEWRVWSNTYSRCSVDMLSNHSF